MKSLSIQQIIELEFYCADCHLEEVVNNEYFGDCVLIQKDDISKVLTFFWSATPVTRDDGKTGYTVYAYDFIHNLNVPVVCEVGDLGDSDFTIPGMIVSNNADVWWKEVDRLLP